MFKRVFPVFKEQFDMDLKSGSEVLSGSTKPVLILKSERKL